MVVVPTAELVEALRTEVGRLQRGGARRRGQFSSGCDALDQLLPDGGFSWGDLVEWLGAGGGTLAMLAAREAARPGGTVVVFDGRREFFPPAAAALGLDLKRMLVVRARGPGDEIWAIDQALRCSAVAAVWAPLTHLERRLDSRRLRRWQLAAEQGGGLGLLLRSPRVRGRPCWSAAQLLVRPQTIASSLESWRLQVELVRGRGAATGGSAELELDEQGALRAAPPSDIRPGQLASREQQKRA